MTHLADRSVLVTGAASGFGSIIATSAAEAGARVVAVDVNVDALDGLTGDLTSRGLQIIAHPGDVTVRADLQRSVAAGIDAFGFVDVAVLNAGIMPLAFFADHAAAAEAWERCIDINFKGVLNGITAVHDHMIGLGRGHVVCISSIYGNHAVQGSAVYSATKAAVNVLADTLRLESQGRIKVTIVRPTGVAGTGLGASVVNAAAISGILRRQPPGVRRGDGAHDARRTHLGRERPRRHRLLGDQPRRPRRAGPLRDRSAMGHRHLGHHRARQRRTLPDVTRSRSVPVERTDGPKRTVVGVVSPTAAHS
jgi:NADP-dependent 3-hydroxy acid dehydrogenase YdfG